jgi:hypothetical protein
MAETPGLRLYEPHLKAHRLVPASQERAQPKECLQVADLPGRDATLACSGEHVAPFASQGARALAARVRGVTSGAEQLLQTLSALLETLEAPESAQQALTLLRSILAILPDELSDGLHATIAQIDWAFLRLLNQPGQPGLIEQVLDALDAPEDGEGAPETGAELHPTEREGLCQLHRDLVSLQQEWDALVDAALPPPAAPPARAPKADLSRPSVAPTPAPGIIVKRRPAAPAAPPFAPLATAARPAGSARRPPSHWLHRARSMRVRVALGTALLFFLLTSGLGVLALKNASSPTSGSGATAALVHQPGPPGATDTIPTPAPTATRQPSAASSTPSAPSFQLKSTPTPRPTATSPAPQSFWCPSENQVCVSSMVLAVPCAGQGTATLQLKNNATQPESWQVTSSRFRGDPLVTISASQGQLQPGQVVTLTVTAVAAQQHLGGLLTITNRGSKGQTLVGLLVCG